MHDQLMDCPVACSVKRTLKTVFTQTKCPVRLWNINHLNHTGHGLYTPQKRLENILFLKAVADFEGEKIRLTLLL